MMNPLTLRLVIRGLESKIESITAAGQKQEADARAAGVPYDRQKMARSRCNLKRLLRRRIVRLESELHRMEA